MEFKGVQQVCLSVSQLCMQKTTLSHHRSALIDACFAAMSVGGGTAEHNAAAYVPCRHSSHLVSPKRERLLAEGHGASYLSFPLESPIHSSGSESVHP